jgi:alpha-tubulin suppressor-like RCC1 family protein
MRSEDKYALSGRLQRVISTMSYLANFFKKSAQPQRYKLLARLTAYSGSLHALAISNDGHILAGGGKRVGTQPWTALITKQVPRASNSGISNLGKNSHVHLIIMNPGEQSAVECGP